MFYVVAALSVCLFVSVMVLVRPVIVRKTVMVHTVEGQTLSGVSISRSPLGVTLKQATHLDTDTALDGDVFVPRRQILFIQKVQ